MVSEAKKVLKRHRFLSFKVGTNLFYVSYDFVTRIKQVDIVSH